MSIPHDPGPSAHVPPQAVRFGAGEAPPPHTAGADGAQVEQEAVLLYVSYALLALGLFTGGATTLVAGVLAHVRKGAAAALFDSHWRFQIRVFWVSVALTLLAGALALATGLQAAFWVWADWGASAVATGVLAVLCFLAVGVWLIAAPAFGAARLASRRPVGAV